MEVQDQDVDPADPIALTGDIPPEFEALGEAHEKARDLKEAIQE